MTDLPVGSRQVNRRAFLAGAIVTTAALAACTRPQTSQTSGISSSAINAAEAARPHTGRTVAATVTAGPADMDVGGMVAHTLAYNGTVPGPLIRANVGDDLAITVKNA